MHKIQLEPMIKDRPGCDRGLLVWIAVAMAIIFGVTAYVAGARLGEIDQQIEMQERV